VPDNVLRLGPEIFSVTAGIVVLLGAALVFAFKYSATSDKAGARGQRPSDQKKEAEIARPDGFIDSFAGVISEAGGGIPFMASIIMLLVIVSYFVYLFLNWNPGR
jgi:hypothetical protein